MTPGDSWDSDDGFSITENDWYTRREEHVAGMARELEPLMTQLTAEESRKQLSFVTFAAYLEQFARALPMPLVRRLLPRPLVFEVPSSNDPYWIVDFAARAVRRADTVPSEAASVVRVPEAVLADAIDKRILHFVHGSMRIRARLLPGGVDEDLAFWGLLMVWEIGYLPVSRTLSSRFAGVLWRRRREALDALETLRGNGSLLHRLAGRFSPPRSEGNGAAPGAPDTTNRATRTPS